MSVDLLPGPTWLVGCGNMAGAMVDGWRAADVDLAQAVAVRPSGRAVEGVRTVRTIAEAGRPPALAILGFKPQQLDEVAPALAPRLSGQTTLVSILAGVELSSLRRRFPGVATIVRVIPNLPVAVRRGVLAVHGETSDEAKLAPLVRLFSVLGYVVTTATEAELAAIGSVAGAGPAYVARFIDALTKAGVQRGLGEQLAASVALETVLGTAWTLAANGEGPDALARRVASPKGTTEAGLAVLDSELDRLVARTIEAAGRRGAELAKDAAQR